MRPAWPLLTTSSAHGSPAPATAATSSTRRSRMSAPGSAHTESATTPAHRRPGPKTSRCKRATSRRPATTDPRAAALTTSSRSDAALRAWVVRQSSSPSAYPLPVRLGLADRTGQAGIVEPCASSCGRNHPPIAECRAGATPRKMAAIHRHGRRPQLRLRGRYVGHRGGCHWAKAQRRRDAEPGRRTAGHSPSRLQRKPPVASRAATSFGRYAAAGQSAQSHGKGQRDAPTAAWHWPRGGLPRLVNRAAAVPDSPDGDSQPVLTSPMEGSTADQ